MCTLFSMGDGDLVLVELVAIVTQLFLSVWYIFHQHTPEGWQWRASDNELPPSPQQWKPSKMYICTIYSSINLYILLNIENLQIMKKNWLSQYFHCSKDPQYFTPTVCIYSCSQYNNILPDIEEDCHRFPKKEVSEVWCVSDSREGKPYVIQRFEIPYDTRENPMLVSSQNLR